MSTGTNEQQVSTKFADIREQIRSYAEDNRSLVFDYESPQGNKDARSQIHKLRSLNGMIDAAHKNIKSDVLAQSRLIDAAKKELRGMVTEMINLHYVPIKAIEDRESARLAAIQKAFGSLHNQPVRRNLKALQDDFNRLCEIEITEEVFQERTEEARECLDESLGAAQIALEDEIKRDKENKELEELRETATRLDQLLREQDIREEAERRATIDAEENARKEIEAANAKARAAENALEERKKPKAIEKVVTEKSQAGFESQAIQYIKDNAGSIGWIAVSSVSGGSKTFGKNGTTNVPSPNKG